MPFKTGDGGASSGKGDVVEMSVERLETLAVTGGMDVAGGNGGADEAAMISLIGRVAGACSGIGAGWLVAGIASVIDDERRVMRPVPKKGPSPVADAAPGSVERRLKRRISLIMLCNRSRSIGKPMNRPFICSTAMKASFGRSWVLA